MSLLIGFLIGIALLFLVILFEHITGISDEDLGRYIGTAILIGIPSLFLFKAYPGLVVIVIGIVTIYKIAGIYGRRVES